MKYLLDSNACIVYLKRPDSPLQKRLKLTLTQDLVLCSVVKAELFYGAKKSQKVEENLAKQRRFFSYFKSLPFDDRAAEIYSDIRASLEIKGTPIGPYDLQIASIAMANQLILVTHNTREFSRIEGLKIADWEVES